MPSLKERPVGQQRIQQASARTVVARVDSSKVMVFTIARRGAAPSAVASASAVSGVRTALIRRRLRADLLKHILGAGRNYAGP
jgi:hypothetical protein